MLYSLALTDQAPKIFRTCNKRGVPYIAVLATAALACLVYLSVSAGSSAVFTWFLNLTTISGFIAWIALMMTYLVHSTDEPNLCISADIIEQRFRKGLVYNNLYDVRPYKSRGQPYTTWFVLFVLVILTLTNGFQVFFPGKFSAASFLAAYITLPIFIVLYLGHKIWFRTPWMYKVSRIDVLSGKDEADRLEEEEIPAVPRNIVERIWFWIA